MNVQLEPHVLTPYFYPRINVSATSCTEEEEPNYDEYQLFCLKTRLRPFLEKYNLGHLSIEFVPVQRGNKFYIGIRLTDAGQSVELQPSDQRRLEEKVNEITTVNRTYCLLYSADTELYLDRTYCRKRIPSVWILSVLPYLPIDPVVNPYVDETYLYVDLSIYPDYDLRYDQMYNQIERNLLELYRGGVIACNATFADDWDLAPYLLLGLSIINNEAELLEDEAISELTDSNGLYIPTWNDVRFAPDRVEFLLSRMAGETVVKIQIHPSPSKKAAIAKALTGREFLFDRDTLVLLDAQDLGDIQRITSQLSLLPEEPVIVTTASGPLQEGITSWQEVSGESFFAAKV